MERCRCHRVSPQRKRLRFRKRALRRLRLYGGIRRRPHLRSFGSATGYFAHRPPVCLLSRLSTCQFLGSSIFPLFDPKPPMPVGFGGCAGVCGRRSMRYENNLNSGRLHLWGDRSRRFARRASILSTRCRILPMARTLNTGGFGGFKFLSHEMFPGREGKMDFLPRCCVDAPCLNRLPKALAREFCCINAGVTAIDPENGGARIAGSRSSLVSIASGRYAHAPAFF